jgi:hypothetical protein
MKEVGNYLLDLRKAKLKVQVRYLIVLLFDFSFFFPIHGYPSSLFFISFLTSLLLFFCFSL